MTKMIYIEVPQSCSFGANGWFLAQFEPKTLQACFSGSGLRNFLKFWFGAKGRQIWHQWNF